MEKYLVTLWGSVEVEAEDRWDAVAKAFEEYDKGNVEISEADTDPSWLPDDEG